MLKLIVLQSLFLTYALGTEITLPLLGKVKGYLSETVNGRQFHAYEGIRYAQPPLGDLRFEEPRPTKPWEGTWEANTLHKCIQYNHYTLPGYDRVIGEEDCLFLNIYTPINKEVPHNVIVFIHGGAFMFNHGGSYGPKFILDRDVILVTLNYRLGPLGFLSTEDSVVPGNNGLKDQLLALQWIKENIQHFGGNPNSITLAGMSAGGASAQLHAISPLSQGLFHRGISQSGTALNPWVMVENSLEKSKRLAEHLECTTATTKDMIHCLKQKSAYDIVQTVKLFQPWLYNPYSPFGVVVDKWSPNPILPEHPYQALTKKWVEDIPWLFSNVESEGLYPGAEFIGSPEYLNEINTRWSELIPHILDFSNTVKEQQHFMVAQEIRDFYFMEKPLTKSTFPILVKLITDRLFLIDIGLATRMHSAAVKSPVYYYHFSYRGAHSKSEYLSRSNENYGAAHGDDTVYILSSNVDTQTTEEDKQTSQLLIDMWISYANTSIPEMGNITMPMVHKDMSEILPSLHIESPSKLSTKATKFLGNTLFWNSLPINENKNYVTERDEL